MPQLIVAYDYDGKEAERENVRQAHRDYLASFGTQLISSGALLAEDGRIIGGASLIDTEDRDEAMRFEGDDPYAKAGIRRSVQIVHWRLRWWMGDFDPAGHTLSTTS